MKKNKKDKKDNTKGQEKLLKDAKEKSHEWFEKYTNSKMYKSKKMRKFLMLSVKEQEMTKDELIEHIIVKFYKKKGFKNLDSLSREELLYILYKIKTGRAAGTGAVVVVAI